MSVRERRSTGRSRRRPTRWKVSATRKRKKTATRTETWSWPGPARAAGRPPASPGTAGPRGPVVWRRTRLWPAGAPPRARRPARRRESRPRACRVPPGFPGRAGRRRAAPGSFRPRKPRAEPPTRARADRTARWAARVSPTRFSRRGPSRCAPAYRRRGASASRACAAPRASRRPARAKATRPAARARESRETTRARRVSRRGTSLRRAPPRGRRRAGNRVPEVLGPGRETREGADTAGRRRPGKSRRT